MDDGEHVTGSTIIKIRGGGRCHNLKIGKEASEDTEESPAGCAGEGRYNKSCRYIFIDSAYHGYASC